MRVGVFSDDFYPESGGVSRSIELQAQQLVAAGHQVVLFLPRHHLQPPPGVTCVGLPQWRLPGTPSYMCSLPVGKRLAGLIAERYPVDVVHSQNERGSIFLAAAVGKALQVPHVHTFHSNYAGTHFTAPGASGFNSMTWMPIGSRWLARVAGRPVPKLQAITDSATADPGSSNALRQSRRMQSAEWFAPRDWMALARFASQVDAFTSPAGFMVESIERASGGALHGHVVPSGVSPAFVGVQRRRQFDGRIRFISAGRLSADKRVDVIVDAFAELEDDHAELVVLGDGPAAAGLRRRAAQVRHGEVRFLGQINDPAEIARQIADADVFCLASYHFDTQGMVLAEAAAAGTAILYCDERLSVGVSPQNSLRCPPDVSGFAQGMRALAADPGRVAKMGPAGLKLIPQLTPEAMCRAYLRIYSANMLSP